METTLAKWAPDLKDMDQIGQNPTTANRAHFSMPLPRAIFNEPIISRTFGNPIHWKCKQIMKIHLNT